MLDAPKQQSSWQKAEHWVSAAVSEAYKHPAEHPLEVAGAAVVAGAAAFATKGLALRLLGVEGAAAREMAAARLSSRLSSRTAIEFSGSMTAERSSVARLEILDSFKRSLGEASQYQLQGLPLGQTFGDQAKALNQLARPVDYAAIIGKDSKVAVFGESHPVDEVRAELGREMPKLRELGFTHLAMEALPSFRQPLIEKYYAGKASAEEVRRALAKDWGWSPGTYMYLIDTAKENGIKIIAADLRVPSSAVNFTTAAERTALRDQLREEQWASLIHDAIKEDPQSRVLLLAGKKHTVIDPQVEQLTTMLNRRNLKPTVVEYAAGWQDAGKRDFFDHTVETAGMTSRRFMVQLDNKVANRPADVFVHLPSLYD